MANLYLTEIPNAPATKEMPRLQTQAVPSIRAKAPSLTVNMSDEAAKLQQSPLPGGFASGMANTVAAQGKIAESAGKGERAMGAAIGEGASKMGDALGKAGWALHTLGEKALDVKDKVAEIEADSNRKIIGEMFERDSAAENWTPQQRTEHWPEYLEKLGGLNSKVGIRVSTQSIIGAQDTAFGQATMYRIQADGYKKVIKDGEDLLNQTIQLGKDTGSRENVQAARLALDKAHAIGSINKAKYDADNLALNRSAKVNFLNETMGTPEGAQFVKEQAEKHIATGKSDLFTKDDDLSLINQAANSATTSQTQFQQKHFDGMKEKILTDPTKVTEEELKTDLEKGKLSADQFAALESARRNLPIAYDAGNVANAFSAASTYDFEADKDQAGRHTMAKYNEVARQIMTTVPKEQQQELLAVLKENWDKGTKKDFSAQEREEKLVIKNIDEWADSGLLPDPITKKPLPTGMKDGKIVNTAEYESNQNRRLELYREAETYRKSHPEFGPNELMDHVYGKIRDTALANATSTLSGTNNVPLVEGQRGFIASLAVPGAPALKGEVPKSKAKAPTADEAKLASDAVKAGVAPPTVTIPQGPGAPVSITVYDKDNAMFREAALPASTELLGVVKKEAQIYGTILKQEAPFREKLALIEDPEMKDTIIRNTTALAKEKKIPFDQAGQQVIEGLSKSANDDLVRIQQALGNQASVPVGYFKAKLAGKEQVFVDAAARHGVDPTLLMAIAAHETGKGTSDMVKNKNNPGGLFDSVKDEYMTFATIEEGIDRMASNLKRNYIDQGLTTIAQIQPKYAPVGAANDPKKLNDQWQGGVTTFQKELQSGGASKSVVMEAGTINPKSQEKLATLEPQVQERASKFMVLAEKWAAENGYEVRITEGYRTPERQEELYAQGRTAPGPRVTNARAGQSNHQSKKAFDIVILKNGKEVDKKEIWSQLGALGKSAGLAWGGDFKSIYDPNHFEFMG